MVYIEKHKIVKLKLFSLISLNYHYIISLPSSKTSKSNLLILNQRTLIGFPTLNFPSGYQKKIKTSKIENAKTRGKVSKYYILNNFYASKYLNNHLKF